jgi:iron(III) transport system substrate-binding protein
MDSGDPRQALRPRRITRRLLLRTAGLGAAAAAGMAVLGCGSSTNSGQQAKPSSASGAPAASNPAFDDLVAAAKKEGKIVISGPPTSATRKDVPAAFKARFGIDMEYLGGPSSDLAARLQSERAAGQYTIDASISGAQTMYGTFYKNGWLQPMKPALILPEVTDDKYWRSGKIWFMDPPGDTVLRLLAYANHPVFLNTKLLPAVQVKSAEVLLDPKFKGKIAAYDPTTNGAGLPPAADVYLAKGEDFWVKLYKGQSVQLSRDADQLADGLAREKYAAVIGLARSNADPLIKDGFPLDDVPLSDIPDTLSGGFGTIAIFDKAPHPNAAKVFANWIASKEGATVHSRAEVAVANRNDIDYSWAPEEYTPKPGVNYFDTYGWDFTVNQLIPLRDKFAQLLK